MRGIKIEHIKGFKNAGYEVYSGKPGCGKERLSG